MSSSLAQPTGQTIQRESFERDAHVCPHPFTVTSRASSVLPGGRSGTVFCFVIACPFDCSMAIQGRRSPSSSLQLRL